MSEEKEINELELLSGVGKWLKDRQKPDDTYYSDKAKSAADYISSFVNKPAGSSTADYQAAKADNTSGEKSSSVFQRMSTNKTAPAGASTTQKSSGGATPSAKPAGSTTGSTGVEKTPTPSQTKMSFSQAYAKARELAKAAGKDPNTAQFKWSKDGGPEKTFQAAAAKKDFVSTNKQYKVDVGSSSTPAGQKPQVQPDGPPMTSSKPKEVSGSVSTLPKNAPLPPTKPVSGPPASAAASAGPSDLKPVTTSSQTTDHPNVTMWQGDPAGSPSFKRPEIVAKVNQQTNYESGGKKKMKEETNPLVAAFLKLQETKTGNMFEAAKKLSKKQDEKMDVVDDDKIDAKDLAALRAKKEVKEENIQEGESLLHPGLAAGTIHKNGDTDYSKQNTHVYVINRNKPKDASSIKAQNPHLSDEDASNVARHYSKGLPHGASSSHDETVVQSGLPFAQSHWTWSKANKHIRANHKDSLKEHVEQVDEGKTDGSKMTDQDKYLHGYYNMYGRSPTQMKPDDSLASYWNTKSDDMRKTKSGKIHGQDQKSKANLIKKRLGSHTQANLPENVEFSEAELAHFNDIMEGRPRKNPIESEEESPTKNVAAQVRTTRSTMTDKGEMVPLKHPITGKTHHVPVKAANDFNTTYAGAGKADSKNKVLAAFMNKHMGGE